MKVDTKKKEIYFGDSENIAQTIQLLPPHQAASKRTQERNDKTCIKTSR